MKKSSSRLIWEHFFENMNQRSSFNSSTFWTQNLGYAEDLKRSTLQKIPSFRPSFEDNDHKYSTLGTHLRFHVRIYNRRKLNLILTLMWGGGSYGMSGRHVLPWDFFATLSRESPSSLSFIFNDQKYCSSH